MKSTTYSTDVVVCFLTEGSTKLLVTRMSGEVGSLTRATLESDLVSGELSSDTLGRIGVSSLLLTGIATLLDLVTLDVVPVNSLVVCAVVSG